MPAILAVTDFSDISTIAVNYACRLAEDHKASVTLLHAYIIPIAFTDSPMPVMPLEDGQKIAEDRMAAMVYQLKTLYPELEIKGKVVYGDVIDSLQDYAEHHPGPWLIALGNSGDTSLLSDSPALEALRHLRFPVLAIPGNVVYRPVRKICFAFDGRQPLAGLPIEEFKTLLAGMNVEVHLLNVADASQEEDASHAEQTRLLHSALSSLAPQYHFVANNDVDEAIQSFVTNNHMDWLVLAPQRHSFLGSLFHKSHTAALVRLSHVPIISLHQLKDGNK